MKKLKKELLFKEAIDICRKSTFIIYCHYNNVTMKEKQVLYNKLSKENVNAKVIKNTILQKVNLTLNLDPILNNNLIGPTTIIYGNTEDINISKLINIIYRHPKLIPIGGVLDNRVLSFIDCEYLRKIPSIEAVYGNLLGQLGLSSAQLANALTISNLKIVKIINAKKE